MIIFVNGKIGGGSPKAGKPYWTFSDGTKVEPKTPFVSQAIENLRDSVTLFPEIDFTAFSHCKDRETQGYMYCKEHMKDIMPDLKKGSTIKFIAHSMGCSFAEGMATFLIERGFTVIAMIHINAFQASKMTANDQVPLTIDFQYTDDIIIHLPFISCPGDIKDAVKIRERSHTRLRRRHRGPVYPNSTPFWERLKPYIVSQNL